MFLIMERLKLYVNLIYVQDIDFDDNLNPICMTHFPLIGKFIIS